MKPPHIQIFQVVGPEGPIELAAIVMDREEFNTLVDEITQVSMSMGIDEAMGKKIKEAGHIPMVARGTKTAFLFERYGIEGGNLSIIVRGQGRKIAEQLFPNPERN